MVNTPSPRTKHYVLAATFTKNASTQTPTNSEDDMAGMTRDAAATENDKNKKANMFSEDLKAALSEAKNIILYRSSARKRGIAVCICYNLHESYSITSCMYVWLVNLIM